MKTDNVQKAIVLNGDGKMLAIRRSSTDTRRPLQWDLPGGHLEDNEEMIAGIKREIKEETGLSVSNVHAIYAYSEPRSWDGGESNVVFITYIAHASSSEVTLSFEHDKAEWLNIEDALELYKYPTHIKILKYVIDNKLVL